MGFSTGLPESVSLTTIRRWAGRTVPAPVTSRYPEDRELCSQTIPHQAFRANSFHRKFRLWRNLADQRAGSLDARPLDAGQ